MQQVLSTKEAEAELEKLYECYLTGTPAEAKTAMQAVDQYVEHLKHGRETAKFLQHARLHILAKALRNEDEAYLEFVKARYWYLKDQEGGNSPSPSDVVSLVKKLTEEQCERGVIAFDEANAKEKEAHFWKALPTGATTAEKWLESHYKE